MQNPILRQLKTQQNKMKSILPKIIKSSHKGQNGRLAIIGGCLEYTGAPFYSSISQLKGGCDLAHIFCTKQAAIPIKAYSPEIITHPYLHSLNEEENPEIYSQQQIQMKLARTVKLVDEWQEALHSFVIGPGLGRDDWIESYLGDIIQGFKKQQIIVLDADGLWYFMKEYQKFSQQGKIFQRIVQNDPQNHILTPNQAEFERLWKCFMEEQPLNRDERIKHMEKYVSEHYNINEQTNNSMNQQNNNIGELQFVEMNNLNHPIVIDAVQLSKKLNNINIIQKGMVDVVTNGKKAFIVVEKSSLKRCGGIGDILSGLVGLYGYWGQRSFAMRNELVQEDINSIQGKEISELDQSSSILLGCVLGSCITRKASYQAYQKYHFSLTAPNVIEYIGPTFLSIYNTLMVGQKL